MLPVLVVVLLALLSRRSRGVIMDGPRKRERGRRWCIWIVRRWGKGDIGEAVFKGKGKNVGSMWMAAVEGLVAAWPMCLFIICSIGFCMSMCESEENKAWMVGASGLHQFAALGWAWWRVILQFPSSIWIG